MITYQELQKAVTENLEEFIVKAMDSHIANSNIMNENEKYYYGENPFLETFKNSLTLKDDAGNSTVIDLTPTIKMPSGFFSIIVGHIVGRLWDNPVRIGSTEKRENGKSKIIDPEDVFGEDFSSVVHQIATHSAIHGVCYAFYKNGNVEMYKATEYMPFPDERTGEHMAGLRFWRVADKKPWVVQLFDMQGITEWRRIDGEQTLEFVSKTTYRQEVPVGGKNYVETTPVTEGEPYSAFPIIPLYTNPQRMSEMTDPIKAKINAYDAKETGYMDEALKMKFIMWIFEGYGGDPEKLKMMLKMMQELGIISVGDPDAKVKAETADIPYESHESTLERLEAAIYRDARIMNPTVLMNGGVTTVAIRAAMQREDKKMVGVESEAREFIRRLCNIANIEYINIAFTHKTLVNEAEIVQMLSAIDGLPFEWQVTLNPAIPQELTEDVIATYEAQSIGMDDESMKRLERVLNNGQTDEQSTDGAG